MKLSKLYLLGIVLLTGTLAEAQMASKISALNPETMNGQNPPHKKGFMSKLNASVGGGIANYYGDLTQNFHLWNQGSFAFSAGVSYPIIPHLNARVDLGVSKVRANDGKNARPDLRARNLSFKSVVWDLSGAIEIEAWNMNKHKFSPYVMVGFGAFYFNPYAIDRYGYKQFLQYLGTEGQGLDAYPDRKLYKRVETEIPFGGGLKWRCHKNVMFQLEFKYRHTNTDYLDDVSRTGYPSKALLDARNPRTAMMTWRGDEVGSGPYPTNPGLNRGNPNKNDAYYTTELKVTFKL